MFFMSACICVYISVCIYIHVCAGANDNLKCHSWGDVDFFFEMESLIGPQLSK